MSDVEEEVFIVEDPEDDKKKEALLRNGEVRGPLLVWQSVDGFCKQRVNFVL